jgi:molecular chaperone DnaK
MERTNSPIIGIDLGTTNSVVAALIDGKVQVLPEDGETILPSVVGMTLDEKLIVGRLAKNQLIAYPERTIASVKRHMGRTPQLTMAGQEFAPQEISAMILRRLRQRAEQVLQTEVTRAVITVPAFFDEDQRQATREAGKLAGLMVERIINEPTAASLVYHAGSPERRHLIVYDLGGGTFDVSIVRVEGGVVEVLSSQGDTQLGGDDFDQRLTEYVAKEFLTKYDYDLLEHPAGRWRLMQACERAKCELSSASTARISEEFLASVEGQAVHLDIEIARHEYERLISPLVERTIECVDQAIRDSKLTISQLDELILVGGSTRTPLVQNRLREEFQREPKWSVDPDLAVALGAATQAAMQEGHAVGPVLIDVATHTLGIEALVGGPYSPQLAFCPIIRRNAPLPAKYEETFRTIAPDQEAANIQVYQGESAELAHNRRIGHFLLDGLNESEDADGEILVAFELTLDGVLKVTAVEHKTGVSKTLKIENSLARIGDEGYHDAQQRLNELFEQSADYRYLPGASVPSQVVSPTSGTPSTAAAASGPRLTPRIDDASVPKSKRSQLIAKAQSLQPSLQDDDAAEVQYLIELIAKAEEDNDQALLRELESELDDLLFYVAE